MSTYTVGASRAAIIIMADNKLLNTQYGWKTGEGLADLIERETKAWAIPQLIEALEECVKEINTVQKVTLISPAPITRKRLEQAQAALAAVKP